MQRLSPDIAGEGSSVSNLFNTVIAYLRILTRVLGYIIITLFVFFVIHYLFKFALIVTLVIVVIYSVGREFDKNKWRFNANLAPVVLRNVNKSSKVIVRCKSQHHAREFIKNPPEINIAGLGGLAWIASNGDSRAKNRLFEILLLSSYKEISLGVSDIAELESLIINGCIELSKVEDEVKL
jgi:hypothetical protein